MSTPADHASWLRRDGFAVPPTADLAPGERDTLTKYGHWMDALTSGRLAAITPDQEKFLRVHRGEEPPTTPFEVAWSKFRQATSAELKRPMSPLELSALFADLEAVRAAVLDVQRRYAFRRMDVMAKVQPELDAIDAEMSPEMKVVAAQLAAVEAAAREAVLAFGRSFHHGPVKATYRRGAITFDSKALQEYSVFHPEVNRFRKEGKPTVAMKYESAILTDAPPEPPPALPGPDESE